MNPIIHILKASPLLSTLVHRLYQSINPVNQETYPIRTSRELLARASNSERTPRTACTANDIFASLLFHVAEVGFCDPPAAGRSGLPEFGIQADALQ